MFPSQPEPLDQIPGPPAGDPNNPAKPNFLRNQFAQPAFKIDNGAYDNAGYSPAAAKGAILGTARDVVIGGLQIPGAQFDAARHKLKVFNSVDVLVRFNGGPHTFSDELSSPWERPQQSFIASLLNALDHPLAAGVHPASLR